VKVVGVLFTMTHEKRVSDDGVIVNPEATPHVENIHDIEGAPGEDIWTVTMFMTFLVSYSNPCTRKISNICRP
jgi:hypothetical protein